jgi:hypothetical protein
MASSIIATTIDETYPVAGIDNDSQGFRDNFSIIKDNFTYAKDEIETLQSDTAKVNTDNNFDSNTISKANFKETTQQLVSVSGSSDINPLSFTSGHFVFVDDVATDITVTITDWPDTDQYAEMYIQCSGNGGATHTVTFASQTPSTTSSALLTDGDAAWTGATLTLSLVTTESKLIKAFTFDGGVTVYLQYIGSFARL